MLLNSTWYLDGTSPKLTTWAGIQRHQLVTKAAGTSSLNLPGTSLAGRPSNMNKFSIKVGKKRGAKKAWSKKVRFITTPTEPPGKRVMREPYQKWTTGATRPKPRMANRQVRAKSKEKSFLSPWTRYWHNKSPFPAIKPLERHFVVSGCVSSFLEYHKIGLEKNEGPFWAPPVVFEVLLATFEECIVVLFMPNSFSKTLLLCFPFLHCWARRNFFAVLDDARVRFSRIVILAKPLWRHGLDALLDATSTSRESSCCRALHGSGDMLLMTDADGVDPLNYLNKLSNKCSLCLFWPALLPVWQFSLTL